jgi:hypothetical protein
MSALGNLVRRHTPVFAPKHARSLRARSNYPTLSPIQLGCGPLRHLAWMFGLDR